MSTQFKMPSTTFEVKKAPQPVVSHADTLKQKLRNRLKNRRNDRAPGASTQERQMTAAMLGTDDADQINRRAKGRKRAKESLKTAARKMSFMPDNELDRMEKKTKSASGMDPAMIHKINAARQLKRKREEEKPKVNLANMYTGASSSATGEKKKKRRFLDKRNIAIPSFHDIKKIPIEPYERRNERIKTFDVGLAQHNLDIVVDGKGETVYTIKEIKVYTPDPFVCVPESGVPRKESELPPGVSEELETQECVARKGKIYTHDGDTFLAWKSAAGKSKDHHSRMKKILDWVKSLVGKEIPETTFARDLARYGLQRDEDDDTLFRLLCHEYVGSQTAATHVVAIECFRVVYDQ